MHRFSFSGLEVPESVLKAMMMRYSDRDGQVRFDDFVSCYIKLKSMMSECLSLSSVFLPKLMLIAVFRRVVISRCFKGKHIYILKVLAEKQTCQNTNSILGIIRCC